jgi:hypothetical protein
MYCINISNIVNSSTVLCISCQKLQTFDNTSDYVRFPNVDLYFTSNTEEKCVPYFVQGVDGRGRGEGGGWQEASLPPSNDKPSNASRVIERRDSHTFRPMSEREAFYSQPMGRREFSHSGAAKDKLYTAYIRDIHIYRPDTASYGQTHLSV